MVRNLIFILMAFFVLTSCKQGSIIISEEDLTEDIFYIDDHITPYTGKCQIIYRKLDQPKDVMTFRNGLLNGEAISYYENGCIKRKGAYKDGYISGKWEFFNENGKKEFEATYMNDTMNGKYISFFQNGKIKEEGIYRFNKKTGIWKHFNVQGNLVEKIKYN